MATAETGPIDVKLIASGGVVARCTPAGAVQVLICGRRAPATWSLPKGKPEPCETSKETALREVREETGLVVRLEDRIGDITYRFWDPQNGARCEKTVTFYLMSPSGGDIARHDPEFDDVRWFDSAEAVKRLTYENEVRILEAAIAMVAGWGAQGA